MQAQLCTERIPNNLFCLSPIWDNFFWHYPWLVLENTEIAVAWELPLEWNVGLGRKWGKKGRRGSSFYRMWGVLSCSRSLAPTEHSATAPRGHELAQSRGQWLFTGKRQGGLLLTLILVNLGYRTEGDDVSANICLLVQNIFPSYRVLANTVNLWVDFRPK